MSRRITSRTEARRHAFHLIFQLPFLENSTENLAQAKAGYLESLYELPGMEELKPATGKNAEYIDRVVWGVLDKKDELDGVIVKFLRDWEISRINKVDLAIMRLCIYEILNENVPPGAAVNEAVEIAKDYGSDESPAFVNGVLGNVAKSIKESNHV